MLTRSSHDGVFLRYLTAHCLSNGLQYQGCHRQSTTRGAHLTYARPDQVHLSAYQALGTSLFYPDHKDPSTLLGRWMVDEALQSRLPCKMASLLHSALQGQWLLRQQSYHRYKRYLAHRPTHTLDLDHHRLVNIFSFLYRSLERFLYSLSYYNSCSLFCCQRRILRPMAGHSTHHPYRLLHELFCQMRV